MRDGDDEVGAVGTILEQCRGGNIKAGTEYRQDDDVATWAETGADVHSSAAASSSFSPGLSKARKLVRRYSYQQITTYPTPACPRSRG